MFISRFSGLLTMAVICFVFGNVTFADKHKDTPTPEASAVFQALRSEYPDSILDDDFKTLKKIIATETYLDFLKQAYPTKKPFQTLAAFIEVAPPAAERYHDYLNEIFEKPTSEDFRGIYQLTLVFRRANVMLAQAIETQNLKAIQAAIKEKQRLSRKNRSGHGGGPVFQRQVRQISRLFSPDLKNL